MSAERPAGSAPTGPERRPSGDPHAQPAVEALDVLVATWRLTLTGAWFLESTDVRQHHDPRPTSRLYRTSWGDGGWVMLREDPDMHQRFVATVTST